MCWSGPWLRLVAGGPRGGSARGRAESFRDGALRLYRYRADVQSEVRRSVRSGVRRLRASAAVVPPDVRSFCVETAALGAVPRNTLWNRAPSRSAMPFSLERFEPCCHQSNVVLSFEASHSVILCGSLFWVEKGLAMQNDAKRFGPNATGDKGFTRSLQGGPEIARGKALHE